MPEISQKLNFHILNLKRSNYLTCYEVSPLRVARYSLDAANFHSAFCRSLAAVLNCPLGSWSPILPVWSVARALLLTSTYSGHSYHLTSPGSIIKALLCIFDIK